MTQGRRHQCGALLQKDVEGFADAVGRWEVVELSEVFARSYVFVKAVDDDELCKSYPGSCLDAVVHNWDCRAFELALQQI